MKQLRDQTTNTPPFLDSNSSLKSKKKLKKKASPSINHTNNQISSSMIPSITKLQKVCFLYQAKIYYENNYSDYISFSLFFAFYLHRVQAQKSPIHIRQLN